MKSKKMAFVILAIFVISYVLINLIPIGIANSYAADKPAKTLSRDINDIDDGLYPGFKSAIKNLQSKHQNYTFLVYYTGMDWNEVLASEYQGHGFSPINLFQIGEKYNGMWICPICGEKRYDNGSLCCASLESLAYMMDPRNSINESDIFQFKDLEGVDADYNDIARVVSKYGEFINNGEVIQAIVDASNTYNINGYFLVAKIIDEHGKNGSTLSNGNGYNGKYVGIYNYFNIGSTGNGKDTIINNGLSYAERQGWNSRRNSIMGGTAMIKQKYMVEYSQNTFYYQKFNVSGKSSMASHQYQQNIMAAQSQGTSLKSYYTSDKAHTFIIPLFKNMPASACTRPSVTTQNKINYEEGIVQNISSSLKVRASASSNGTVIGALNNNEPIKILKRAENQVDGYFWDMIVSTRDGTYGYSARASKSGEQYLVSKGVNGSSGGSVSQTDPYYEEPKIEETPNVEKPPLDLEKDIQVSDSFLKAIPDINVENIKSKYNGATIKKSDGTVVDSGNVGTGYTVTLSDGATYKVVKKGDTNGDANVNVIDAIVLLNAIKGTKTLENEYKQAATVKNGDSFNITDAVLLLNYIKGTANISL